jgi:hypothetical protein
MRRCMSIVAVFLLLGVRRPTYSAAEDKEPNGPVLATVESTLATSGDHIRQFVLDGDPDSYFASEANPTTADRFTVVFDHPVEVKSIAVVTGRPSGEDALKAGKLEVSKDGKQFESLATFSDGAVKADGGGRWVTAIRLRPTNDMDQPLAIREFTIESTPQVALFKDPVEFLLDLSDAPGMEDWARECIRICERAYPMINEELTSDGFKPAHLIELTLKPDYGFIAATSGAHIMGQIRYFKEHPDDFGAMVHETVHVVQGYRGRNPGWLVEGIPDYVRFFKYEPGKAGPVGRNPHYDGSYRVTATFLNYVTEKYDRQLVKKLNAAMRQGKYSDDLFKDYTGKTVTELDDEWRASLKKTT